jgi:hypothetical protein
MNDIYVYKMDLPIAVPVGDGTVYKSSELYTLEQKQEAFMCAEKELESVIRSSEDFFDTKEEMDKTLQELHQHPDASYTKPFMKKIASAILRLTACKQDMELASESVVDTNLTPAQVKAQIKHMLDAQRIKVEQIEERMNFERMEWTTQLSHLRQELEEERRHRKAFQAKVKDFSEYVYLVFAQKHNLFDLPSCPDNDSEVLRSTIDKIIGNSPLAKHFKLIFGCDNPKCDHSKRCSHTQTRTELPIYLKYKDMYTRPEYKDGYYPDPMYILPNFETE